jgi:asparagine synthase (glutamine-hydrolysing)
MCGIVGAAGLAREPDPDLVEQVLDSIRHRGPDAAGHVFRDGTWLGSRRLKVLDLRDEANQPMADEASGVVLVYNGELYNFLELREELERLGHRFETSGDTEVLLRGYLEWGDALFPRCNGMWAIAIRDPRRGGTLLCRDRFGEKPLYLGRAADGAWWFGSEAATLRLAGAGSGRFDASRVLNFLLFGDAEDPTGSFFDGISQVKPGHCALVGDDGEVEERAWWRLSEFARERWGNAAPQPEEIEAALDRAVRLRLRSDVLVGSSLSGGIDSSTILGSIRSLDASREIHVFTASFPGEAVDEWARASRVAEEFGATAHRVEPTLDGFLASLPLLVRRQGGPFDSPSVYAQWCVMEEAASSGVTVLLDGQGADETWGGYRKYVWFAVGEALLRGDVASANRIVGRWRSARDLPPPDALQVGGLALPAPGRHLARLALRRLHRWIGPALLDAALVDPQGAKVGGPLLRQAAVADGGRVILPRLLRYADRNSMAWSRELRLPFLDLEVVGHAFSSGWRSGLESGWTKEPLRRVAARRLPEEIVWRRGKTAYDVPEERWLPQARVQEQLRAAVALLQDLQIVERASSLPLSPWRALSLASFLDQSGLAA